MSQKIVVGPINKGIRTDRIPFNIDNDSFPTLLNAYQWRGRIKRKRGTSLLGRLTRHFDSTKTAYGSTSSFNLVAGAGNLITAFGLQTNGSIVPGTVTLKDNTANQFYTDFLENGTLNPAAVITAATNANPCVLTANNSFNIGDSVYISGVGGMTQLNGNTYTITNRTALTITINVNSLAFGVYTTGGFASDLSITGGTINYATGAITITGGAGHTINTVTFDYQPDLPVMGLEDLELSADEFPGTIAFDTTYSYNINTSFPYTIFDVSFYKNLISQNFNGISYTQKTNWTPTTWNGQTYQQFYTANYQGALWATNGITVPFTIANVGMQYQIPISATRDSATQMTFVIADPCPLVIGDWVFVNEWVGSAGGVGASLNFQTGFVESAVDGGVNTTVVVRFPWATIAAGNYASGIVQYLTNRSDVTKDCLRWYDGAPVNASGVFSFGKGWVNFAPPLSEFAYNILELPPAQYYLVGARMIVPFKDRLLFIGPVVQTSSANSQIYLQDFVIYSQNGTPYYTASFAASSSADVTSSATVFHPLLTPIIQNTTAALNGANPSAYFADVTGFGGFVQAGYAQPITTVNSNEDVLIMGFTNRFSRFVFTGDDITPFVFYTINSELGSNSTFSAISMDQAGLSIGGRGITAASQVSVSRIDLDLPDQVFEISLENNGAERICSQRDFINEWVYFTYRSDNVDVSKYIYPSATLQYNYRDNSWGIFYETYTTYGSFRSQSGFTWATVGNFFPSWNDWNESWDSGSSNALQQKVIAGNQQGFVIFRDEGTSEATSLYIKSFSGSTITVPDHGLREGDYIIISGVIGTVGQFVNGQIFSVAQPSQNAFRLNPGIGTGTYFGGGLITRMYVPYIQTKEFPVSWDMARKTRIGNQQYLFTTTSLAQITLLIFLSQNNSSAYNIGPIVPDIGSVNNSLLYSTVLYTCPESTNLGLTPSNINLNLLTAPQQDQTWHRMNTSLLGDTVQIGFTLSDQQMRAFTPTSIALQITGATNAYPTVVTVNNSLSAGAMVLIQGVEGMTELEGYFQIISRNATTITINVDSTAFGVYTTGGTVTVVGAINQFAEIEMHGMILSVSPSQLLA